MKSGSKDIQKRMELQVPRLAGELKKEWFMRMARFYEITVCTAENLYYREGYSVPNETYIKLRNLGQIPTTPSENRLSASLKQKEEINELIRVHANEITKQVMHNIVHGLQQSMERIIS